MFPWVKPVLKIESLMNKYQSCWNKLIVFIIFNTYTIIDFFFVHAWDLYLEEGTVYHCLIWKRIPLYSFLFVMIFMTFYLIVVLKLSNENSNFICGNSTSFQTSVSDGYIFRKFFCFIYLFTCYCSRIFFIII